MTISDALTVTITALVSLGGGGVIVFALSSWLGHVWASRILEQDRVKYQKALQTELERVRGDRERNVLVHRIQFESEFRAYQEVWHALSICVEGVFAFRPMLDYFPEDKSKEEVKNARLKEFSSKYSSLQGLVRKHKPFLASNLDSHWGDILAALEKEAIEYEYSDVGDRRESREKRKRNLGVIQQHMDKISDAIRERIGLLVVIDDK